MKLYEQGHPLLIKLAVRKGHSLDSWWSWRQYITIAMQDKKMPLLYLQSIYGVG